MKVLDPGHLYELQWLDGEPEDKRIGTVYVEKHDPDESFLGEPVYAEPPNHLMFVKREGEKYPGNKGHHPGTTIQEVLRVLIDRIQYLQQQIPDERNEHAIADLRHAIWCMEKRAAERHGREFNLTWWGIESYPTCSKCLHIGCGGECHP